MHSSRVSLTTAALWFALALLLFICVGCHSTPTAADKPTIWAFGAEWCAACVRDKPALAELARSGRARVVEVDADANPEIAAKFHVKEYPTYVILHKNRVVWRGHDLEIGIKYLSHR